MFSKVSPSTPAEPPFRRTCFQASIKTSSRHILSASAWNRRPGSSFAFACSVVWNCRTLFDPVRRSSVVTPCSLSTLLSNQGSFPPPALPGLDSNTSPSATLPARPAPRGVPVWRVPRHRQGFPCCLHPPLPCVPPPLPRWNRPVLASLASRPMAAFPVTWTGRLPRRTFRGLLGVHSRCSPHGRWAARGGPSVGVLQTMSLPPSSAPIATGWSDSCRAGFAPAGGWRLTTAHHVGRVSVADRGRQPYRPRRNTRMSVVYRSHDRRVSVRVSVYDRRSLFTATAMTIHVYRCDTRSIQQQGGAARRRKCLKGHAKGANGTTSIIDASGVESYRRRA